MDSPLKVLYMSLNMLIAVGVIHTCLDRSLKGAMRTIPSTKL